jgi:hypothetical protein
MKSDQPKKRKAAKVIRMTILDEWVINARAGKPKVKPSRTAIEPVVSFAKKKK